MRKLNKRDIDDLYSAILQLESLDECRRFFRDLLTKTEIEEFTERWKAARLLADGVPYRKIEMETGISSRTIARVAQWLKKGKGGYSMMMQKTTK
jgi:TrpR-related protein YerC/YecD